MDHLISECTNPWLGSSTWTGTMFNELLDSFTESNTDPLSDMCLNVLRYVTVEPYPTLQEFERFAVRKKLHTQHAIQFKKLKDVENIANYVNIDETIFFILRYIITKQNIFDWFLNMVAWGHVGALKLMLQDPRIDPSMKNNYAISAACLHGNAEVTKLLLEDKRVDPCVNFSNPIRTASSRGYADIVRLLLDDKRSDPSAASNEAIRWAALYGHVEVVKLLAVHPDVDPSDENNELLCFACACGHTEIVKTIMNDPRVNLNARNGVPWKYAIHYGCSDIIDLLVSKGVGAFDVTKQTTVSHVQPEVTQPDLNEFTMEFYSNNCNTHL
jgi:hypothetical protein